MRRILAGFLVYVSLIMPALAAPETSAKTAFIIDATTGTVLLEKNPDMRVPTASMSKTMTVAVVFDAMKQGLVKPSDTYTVSEKAWRMGGSKMFVEVGKSVPVEDLLKGVIVQSGNDATIVLAEGLAGTEEAFALRMNHLAEQWGLQNSHFVNASGWPDPNHYSSARDLATIAWRVIHHYPEEHKLYAMREYTWNDITQPNRNPLLGVVDGADGLKTGHTEEAGYGLIGTAMRDGRRVIMVLTGMSSMKERATEGARLIEWALRNFKVEKLLTAGQVITRAPVVYGLAEQVPLVIEKDVVTSVPVTYNPKDLQVKVKYKSPLVAPVQAGAEVGTVTVSVKGMDQALEYKLLAASSVDKKGFFGLTLDKIVQAAKGK